LYQKVRTSVYEEPLLFVRKMSELDNPLPLTADIFYRCIFGHITNRLQGHIFNKYTIILNAHGRMANASEHRTLGLAVSILVRYHRTSLLYRKCTNCILHNRNVLPSSAPPNGPLRKRYASESEKMVRHVTSRPPQCQAIHEELDPPLVYHNGPDIQQAKRQNLSLDLQPQHPFPENVSNHIKDPTFGRLLSDVHSHSNPGSPLREHLSHFPGLVASVPKQGHVFPPPSFSEQPRQDSVESKSSPTKSNPSTPMHEGRLPNFPAEGDRRRNYSGPNYLMNHVSYYLCCIVNKLVKIASVVLMGKIDPYSTKFRAKQFYHNCLSFHYLLIMPYHID